MDVLNEIGQMMNCLKFTGLRLGYILNFNQPKLEWRRVVLCATVRGEINCSNHVFQ